MHKELWQRLSDVFKTAEAFHRESSLTFYWLGLYGYSALHHFQWIEEQNTHENVLLYGLSEWGLAIEPNTGSDARILGPLTRDIDRDKISVDETKKLVEKLFKYYREWEESARAEYSEIAEALRKDNHLHAALYVDKLVEDTDSELMEVKNIICELKAMDYDLATIVSFQQELKTKYDKMLSKLF